MKRRRTNRLARCGTALLMVAMVLGVWGSVPRAGQDRLRWQALPDMPVARGVGGALVGSHRGALIVAGGTSFPEPVWETAKVWHDDAWVLAPGRDGGLIWHGPFKLDRPRAYAATASLAEGVACLGGNDGQTIFDDAFLLSWDAEARALRQTPLPRLPGRCAYGSAAGLGSAIYLAGGLTSEDLGTAQRNFWRLDCARLRTPEGGSEWEVLPPWPGPGRAFNLTVVQHNGFDDCVYVLSGRRANDTGEAGGVAGRAATDDWFVLHDVYEFNPRRFREAGGVGGTVGWRPRANLPWGVMAGTAVGMGQSHIFVLSGDDGSRVAEVEALRDEHPGFRREVLAYHTITDTWVVAGESAANQVTTAAAPWAGGYVVATGEVRPRHRTSAVWWVKPTATTSGFGAIDFVVLAIYLLAMVGVGVGLARRNANTEDYFRGSQRTRWWVAGCSIFATMLSSITYMAIPAKAFAQDLVYLVGNFMILAVAPIAIYLALPFFRRLDVTSAYEYLERRFNRSVRWFASVSFTLFHIFRMGIVMSLAALALATITPLSAAQCVLLMGGLSVLYCTLGGIAAVMWTDTIQTVVLLGGGLLCFALAVAGATGGWGEAWCAALEDGKLRAYNPGWDPTSPALVLWVVALGAIGQNVSSYTADQAVVQRYLTTPDPRRAAHSIWAAALLAIPASILFYLLGTALYLYYKSHPEQLDPTFMTDQILPQFIAHAVPSGVAGLIVAGIFAAAQSTISTSMNSTATAVVTDFLRPLGVARDERGYLRWARALTLASGLGGTALGVTFIDPANRSLFDSFLRVVGLFMGVLGGLFLLGMLTRRATGWGAMIGAMAGASVMALLPICTAIHGYLYAAIGIAVCFVVGYAASRLWPAPADIRGLTIHTRASGLRSKP